jgi:hypothetical protein
MKKIVQIAMFLLVIYSSYAQETVLASGGETTGDGSLSFSIGQLVNNTNNGSNGAIYQGVQQSIELYVLSNNEYDGTSLMLSAYPNPTSNVIVLQLSNYINQDLTYQLYDLLGKLVLKGEVMLNETSISLESAKKGTYILKINDKNKELNTFKIIKK